MLHSIDILLKRMIDTIQDIIIPDLATSHAKGQALSMTGILNNLVGKLEEKQAYYLNANKDISYTLEEISKKFEVIENTAQLQTRIIDGINGNYGISGMTEKEKNTKLKGLLEEILLVLEEHKHILDPVKSNDIHEIINRYLRKQLDVELRSLSGSDMGEILKN